MAFDIGKILSMVGGAAINAVIPGAGPLVVGAINSFLPDDKKLPDNATGAQAQSAVSSLPAEKQAELLSKEYDVELAEIKGWTDRFASMAQVDATGNTTRPAIALMMSKVICFQVVSFSAACVVAIINKDYAMLEAVGTAWALVSVMIGIPAGIVNSYFGKRTKEKSQKYGAISGVCQQEGALSQVLGAFKK